ncbi:CcdB family protein [Rhizomicrobium electricum]|nr:CcdB family protein [Rhizomicrobium electricum]NIJ47708.1 toxin CcdB [Rhizomicrobium electricum]
MSTKQFDVFANPDPASVKTHPYLIVLQSDQLSRLNTRVVAPLVSPKSIPFFERLTPGLDVNGDHFVIDPTNIGAVPERVLKKRVANLESERYRILAAVDMVFVGV